MESSPFESYTENSIFSHRIADTRDLKKVTTAVGETMRSKEDERYAKFVEEKVFFKRPKK